MVTVSEARTGAYNNRFKFLDVTRPELNLSRATGHFSAHVYEKARENLHKFISMGAMQVIPKNRFYAYQLINKNHSQIGLACGVLLSAYRSGVVKRHELTRTEKEKDRVDHIRAVKAQTGPVLLTHKPHRELTKLLSDICNNDIPPEINVTLDGDTFHKLWPVKEPFAIKQIMGLADELGTLYIADGHHRCAAAEKVSNDRNNSDARFLGVLFPSNELRILAYNRVLKDLGELNEQTLLTRLEQTYALQLEEAPFQPDCSTQIGLCLKGGWWRLDRRVPISKNVPITERLDASLLMEDILTPLFNIKNPREDPRLDFIGGVNSLDKIMNVVKNGQVAAGFTLFPTKIEQLIEIADLGELMPPKSTWFEPKLADGLIVHILD